MIIEKNSTTHCGPPPIFRDHIPHQFTLPEDASTKVKTFLVKYFWEGDCLMIHPYIFLCKII